MNKKSVFYQMFEEKFNANQMKEQIFLENRKEKRYIFHNYKYVGIIVVMIVICSAIIFANKKDDSKAISRIKSSDSQSNIVNINKVNHISQNRLKIDGLRKNIAKDTIEDVEVDGSTLVVPSDLKNIELGAIYVKSDNSEIYDKLANYEYSYYNEKEDRGIILLFSKDHKPARDYHFTDIGKISKINGCELTIYQYEDSFMIEFIYNSYYFDIETHNINIDELEKFLQSLIK